LDSNAQPHSHATLCTNAAGIRAKVLHGYEMVSGLLCLQWEIVPTWENNNNNNDDDDDDDKTDNNRRRGLTAERIWLGHCHVRCAYRADRSKPGLPLHEKMNWESGNFEAGQ
jgi:hypothetical protein